MKFPNLDSIETVRKEIQTWITPFVELDYFGTANAAQIVEMIDAVRAKKLPVAYLTFEGEQHGFRKAKNIKRVLEAKLCFYSKVFGFELAESVEPVRIENL
jgi:hypothetical protein